ncbi:MAG: hypothetical protein EPN33_02150 [Acidobacteria bacterium]|nr:MAG: hypothetical protein EPN33_02150 [Acidobacteriota bacterium]
MRSLLIPAIGLALTLGTIAQGPPKNAVDITNSPAIGTQAQAAPRATADASSGVIRVYIGTLNGADATAIQGLLTQALFESKKVVITENQGNASVILQGRVLRRAIPVSPVGKAGKKRRSHKAAAPDTTAPSVIQDLQALNQGGSIRNLDNGTLGGSSALNALGMPSLNTDLNGGEEDLSQYQFRLYLQLVNPDGDLVWMSGEGGQAPPFSSAGEAVNATVQPMLTAIASLPKSSFSSQP